MRKESCETCRFVGRSGTELNRRLCKRNAPIAVPVQQGQGMGVITIYPPTAPDEWCGEYQHHLES